MSACCTLLMYTPSEWLQSTRAACALTGGAANADTIARKPPQATFFPYNMLCYASPPSQCFCGTAAQSCVETEMRQAAHASAARRAGATPVYAS